MLHLFFPPICSFSLQPGFRVAQSAKLAEMRRN